MENPMQPSNHSIRAALSLPILFLISACGGGGVDGGGTGPSPEFTTNYQTLNSTANTSSTLVGSAAKGNATTGNITVSGVVGTLNHNTGRLVLNDGTYAFVDPNGLNNGVATDGSSVLTADGNQGFSGSYDFVTAYEQTYVAGGDNYTVPGFYGVGTTDADSNLVSGTVTYRGEARGVVGVSSSSTVLTNGDSTVSVNFNSNNVNVILNNFDTSTAPIDEIRITGMTLSGGEYTGGSFTTLNNGSNVFVTGANTSTDANGNLFGVNSAGNAPDETAGIVVSYGDSGLVVGAFIAD